MHAFLRKSRVERDPLPVVMSGVRLGERVLQIADGNARVIASIASKTGLTGTAAIVVADDHIAERVRRALSASGALAEVRAVSSPQLPFDSGSFDAVVVHDVGKTVAAPDSLTRDQWLRECRRLLRDGGRLVTIEPGTPVGLRSLFAGARQSGTGSSQTTLQALRGAGFKSARLLGDREGLRFVEGLKTD